MSPAHSCRSQSRRAANHSSAAMVSTLAKRPASAASIASTAGQTRTRMSSCSAARPAVPAIPAASVAGIRTWPTNNAQNSSLPPGISRKLPIGSNRCTTRPVSSWVSRKAVVSGVSRGRAARRGFPPAPDRGRRPARAGETARSAPPRRRSGRMAAAPRPGRAATAPRSAAPRSRRRTGDGESARGRAESDRPRPAGRSRSSHPDGPAGRWAAVLSSAAA